MLGTTAGGLFWMFRYLERSENTARLVEAGLRMALTRSSNAAEEWESVVTTAGALQDFTERYDTFDASSVIRFLLQDETNPSSVRSVIESARNNARLVRTALTREVWEATNETWMSLTALLSASNEYDDLPRVLAQIRQESAYVRGSLHGTMMRNDIYNFCRLGTFIERSDNTGRILDVKYYVLLPSAQHVGSRLDNVQWENILRSVSAQRAYRWRHPGDANPRNIAEFLILDKRMPRSLAFCFNEIGENLGHLADDYGTELPCHETARAMQARIRALSIDAILDRGLHEFLSDCISHIGALAQEIDHDYRLSR